LAKNELETEDPHSEVDQMNSRSDDCRMDTSPMSAISAAVSSDRTRSLGSLSDNDAAFEVRWMATGNVACSLESKPSMCATDVMAQVCEYVGVPIDEQRLFADGREIRGEDVLPGVDAYEVTLVRTVSDPRITNLHHFHPTGTFQKVPRSSFTTVAKIGQGVNGDVHQQRYRDSKEDDGMVAVKRFQSNIVSRSRMQEKDERAAHQKPGYDRGASLDDPMTEIGVLSYLSTQPDLPQYLIKMVDIFQDAANVWVITEFAEGGELFKLAESGPVAEEHACNYVFQMLQAIKYLHQHCIGHRDISLENVLRKRGIVKLIDFGQAVLSHTANGTPLRYFRRAGKDYYRAPECYVPKVSDVYVNTPGGACGEVHQMQVNGDCLCDVRLAESCGSAGMWRAEVWGYQACPADIFSLGICAFILIAGYAPWQVARPNDAAFALACEQGLEAAVSQQGKQPCFHNAMDLIGATLQPNPVKRPSSAACLSNSWFAHLPK
jgi:serine/threonine protein kinase